MMSTVVLYESPGYRSYWPTAIRLGAGLVYPTAYQMSVACRLYGSNKPVKGGFVVIVSGKLTEEQLQKMVELFKPLAAHVAAHEEECYAYELSLGAEAGAFVIYERYTSKEYLEQVHCQSEPFKQFVAAVTALGIDLMKFVTTYTEADLGFA